MGAAGVSASAVGLLVREGSPCRHNRALLLACPGFRFRRHSGTTWRRWGSRLRRRWLGCWALPQVRLRACPPAVDVLLASSRHRRVRRCSALPAVLPAVLRAERPLLSAEQLEHPEPLEEVEAVLERVRQLHRLD